MALHAKAMELIAPYLKGADVLSLGYPDILMPWEQCERVFGYKPMNFTNRNLNHGVKYLLPETMELMGAVCKSFECVDIARLSNVERIVDLNEPIDLGKFDLVIDPGTTEHCFNIGQAIMNSANAVRQGGRIVHMSPVSMVNHGFYNPCPTAWHDFYTQNGFAVEHFTLRFKGGDLVAGDLTERSSERMRIQPEGGVCFLAQRVTEQAIKWPIQAKYAVMLKDAA